MITVISASTTKMWITPPKVYEVTSPSAHSTSKTTAMVQSI
jgi:hypothetical protein